MRITVVRGQAYQDAGVGNGRYSAKLIVEGSVPERKSFLWEYACMAASSRPAYISDTPLHFLYAIYYYLKNRRFVFKSSMELPAGSSMFLWYVYARIAMWLYDMHYENVFIDGMTLSAWLEAQGDKFTEFPKFYAGWRCKKLNEL